MLTDVGEGGSWSQLRIFSRSNDVHLWKVGNVILLAEP